MNHDAKKPIDNQPLWNGPATYLFSFSILLVSALSAHLLTSQGRWASSSEPSSHAQSPAQLELAAMDQVLEELHARRAANKEIHGD